MTDRTHIKDQATSTAKVQSGADAVRTHALALSSGRTLEVRTSSESDAGRDTIELKSRDGALELRITMTPEGPMIHVKGGSLAVEAADAVSVACKRFDVRASEGIHFAAGNLSMASEGEVRIRSQGNTHMDSEVLHLNCGDRSGYPPPPEFIMPEEMRELGNTPTQAESGGGCGCEAHHPHSWSGSEERVGSAGRDRGVTVERRTSRPFAGG